MKLRRLTFVLTGLIVAGSAMISRADGWAANLFASPDQKQQAADDAATVQKDDSQLWVVERPNTDAPLVDVANKKKKPPTFWNRVWHPSQWFSSKKK